MSKKIQELTPDQETRFDEYVERFVAAGLSTEPADRARAEDCVKRIYAVAGLAFRDVKIEWFDSPAAAMDAARNINNKISVGDFCYGNHDAGWLSFYAYMREVVGLVEETESITPLIDMSFVAGWWLPCDDRVYMCERPSLIHVDNDGNLHNTAGPALSYPDGFSVYAVRGVSIPEKWVTTEPPSVQDALQWDNIEQRRAAAEIVGWENILQKLDARIVDADADDMIGSLYEAQLPDAEGKDKFLRVKCGTGRYFTIPVDRACKTALEAQSKLWRLPENIVAAYERRT